jgi:hypothetical protein
MLTIQQRHRSRAPGRVVTAFVAMATTMLGTMLAVTLRPAPASADAFGGCYGFASAQGCVPDNFNHWYCFSGAVNTNLRTAFATAMTNLDNLTRYAAFVEGAGCNGVTDLVVVQNTALPLRGQYTCEAKNAFGDCERATLSFNPNNLTTANDRVKTACHEIGHSVGLKHGITDGASPDNGSYTDCMKSGAITAGLDFDGYDAHHVVHINNRA